MDEIDYGVPATGITLMPITPDLAGTWLTEFENLCRPADERHIERLADDMRMGFWTEGLRHNSIKFDQNLALVDGARRLMAVIRSGETINMAVERVITQADGPP